MRVDDDDVAGNICQGLPRPIGAGGGAFQRHARRARVVKRLNRAFFRSPGKDPDGLDKSAPAVGNTGDECTGRRPPHGTDHGA